VFSYLSCPEKDDHDELSSDSDTDDEKQRNLRFVPKPIRDTVSSEMKKQKKSLLNLNKKTSVTSFNIECSSDEDMLLKTQNISISEKPVHANSMSSSNMENLAAKKSKTESLAKRESKGILDEIRSNLRYSDEYASLSNNISKTKSREGPIFSLDCTDARPTGIKTDLFELENKPRTKRFISNAEGLRSSHNQLSCKTFHSPSWKIPSKVERHFSSSFKKIAQRNKRVSYNENVIEEIQEFQDTEWNDLAKEPMLNENQIEVTQECLELNRNRGSSILEKLEGLNCMRKNSTTKKTTG